MRSIVGLRIYHKSEFPHQARLSWQLRDDGRVFADALIEATRVRFRPIVMTGITTAAGSVPLLLSSGAGSETRVVIGTVIVSGVIAATFFTLFVVPVACDLLARRTDLQS